jgi:hypothetical protein
MNQFIKVEKEGAVSSAPEETAPNQTCYCNMYDCFIIPPLYECD